MENTAILWRRLTVEQVKQKIQSQIDEFSGMHCIKVDVTFNWMPTASVGSIRRIDSKKYILKVNMFVFLRNYLNKNNFGNLLIQNYLIMYIMQYIFLFTDSFNRSPDSYPEGLAVLDIYLRFCDNGVISCNMPLLTDFHCFNRRKSFPADIYCSAAAIKALKNTNSNFENTLLQQYYDILSICSELPETVYIGSKLPIYTSLHMINKLAEISKRKKTTALDSHFQTECVDNITSMTLSELFDYCSKTNNNFYSGFAVRLLTHCSDEEIDQVLKKENSKIIFSKSADEFKKNAVQYMKIYKKMNYCYCRDNAIAIQKTVNHMNEISSRYHLSCTGGSVYSFFC